MGIHDPCCCHLWTHPHHATALDALRQATHRAAQCMSKKGPRASTIIPLMHDMVLLAMNWARDTPTWLQTIVHLCPVMAVLADRDLREDNISPPTDTSPRPKRKPSKALPLQVDGEGIGAAGSIPIPPYVR